LRELGSVLVLAPHLFSVATVSFFLVRASGSALVEDRGGDQSGGLFVRSKRRFIQSGGLFEALVQSVHAYMEADVRSRGSKQSRGSIDWFGGTEKVKVSAVANTTFYAVFTSPTEP
jgi:hypothetical protein